MMPMPKPLLMLIMMWRMCTRISSSIVLRPYGRLMCISLPDTDNEIISNFHIHNLSCVVEDCKREPKRETYPCASYSRPNTSEMRCVMCTEIPGYAVEEEVCQKVNNHIVCAVISYQRSCVFTTNTFRKSLDPTDRYEQLRGCCHKNRSKQVRSCQQRTFSKSKQDGQQLQIRRNVKKCQLSMTDKIENKRIAESVLLEGRESVECTSRNIGSVINIAAAFGHDRIFNLLLGLGVKLGFTGKPKRDPLFYAVRGKQMKILRHLVELGVNVNHRYKYVTSIIHLVARGGTEDMFDYLVEMGVDVKRLTKRGSNILERACKGNRRMAAHIYKRNFAGMVEEAYKHGDKDVATCLMNLALA